MQPALQGGCPCAILELGPGPLKAQRMAVTSAVTNGAGDGDAWPLWVLHGPHAAGLSLASQPAASATRGDLLERSSLGPQARELGSQTRSPASALEQTCRTWRLWCPHSLLPKIMQGPWLLVFFG